MDFTSSLEYYTLTLPCLFLPAETDKLNQSDFLELFTLLALYGHEN
jgi:hypothetical protein